MSEDEETGKVVVFPRVKRDRLPQSIEEIQAGVSLAKEVYADDMVREIVMNLFDDFESRGFDVLDKRSKKSASLVIQAVYSLALSASELDHPLQDLAEKLFEVDAKGDSLLVDFRVREVSSLKTVANT